ncbi:MAG: CoA-binding protein [Oscillatoria sp. SIO1A7]|nr:CoA-binding protein [Oscillatoria sp. SIO1A7]
MNINPDSKVLVQGIIEPIGSAYAARMKAIGTQVVAGVSPGHGGKTVEDIPTFDMVEEALVKVGQVDVTIIFSSAYWVLDAAKEAIAAGIRQIIIVTEGVPPLDMVELVRKAEATETLVVGANTPGIIMPGKILLGTHPQEFYTPGSVGIISRSGTLTYEIAWELTQAGLGQSICVGIGGDTIVGSSFSQWLQVLDEDENTEAIVVLGEIGGSGEEAAAQYISEAIDKPVVAYVAGRYIPQGKRLGSASNLLVPQPKSIKSDKAGDSAAAPESAQSKIAAFQKAGVPVADRPSEIANILKKALKQKTKKK